MTATITLRSGVRVHGRIVDITGAGVELDDPQRCFHRNIDHRSIAAVHLEV